MKAPKLLKQKIYFLQVLIINGTDREWMVDRETKCAQLYLHTMIPNLMGSFNICTLLLWFVWGSMIRFHAWFQKLATKFFGTFRDMCGVGTPFLTFSDLKKSAVDWHFGHIISYSLHQDYARNIYISTYMITYIHHWRTQ